MKRFALFALLITALPIFAQNSNPSEPYKAAVEKLVPWIEREVAAKNIPALSIALVDDQRIVWSQGFGHEDAKKTRPASEKTIYRVGSVSKLFTDLAIMKLVEEGKLDLDAPVSKYITDFKPVNPFDKTEVTLRHLMAHRSGLVRESPVGNYFDDSDPTLEKTVQSLNGIDLVYKPGEKIKYSNAAIATVGRVLEVVQKKPFSDYLKASTLDPLGMKSSWFTPTAEAKKHLAEAVMWSYHGREFPAPTFELGMAPAGSMYTTVGDLGKFMSVLFNDGKPFMKPESLEEMFKLQFAKPGDKQGFGLGFIIGELDGKKRMGHGGAIYGFATELAFLPKEKLGVIVTCSRDVANGLTSRIADESLRMMLAAKAKKALPEIAETTALKPGEATGLAGTYTDGKDKFFELSARDDHLYFWPGRGGMRLELRKDGADFRIDDRQSFGQKLTRPHTGFKLGDTLYTSSPSPIPAAPSEKFLGLIGEYGWDHNTLFVYEHRGQLYCLIEWVFVYPLSQVSDNVYAFPDHGLYHGEKLIFKREKLGRASEVEAAKVVFKRRKIDGDNGETFKIKPVMALEEIRKAALAAKPPVEMGVKRKFELVDLETVSDTLKFDIRYATKNNFLSEPFYTEAKAYMQKPAAEALAKVQADLKEKGYGLLIFDAYRPWYVSKMFWDATPEKFHNFVADPSKGSRHNRGCAVDLTLYDLKTGKPVEMVSGYDEFSDRAYPDYVGGTSLQRWHRDLLRKSMEARGFKVYEAEWWHYDFKDWKEYGLGNDAFEKLGK